MKTPRSRFFHYFFGLVALSVTTLHAGETDKVDPLAGSWTWHHGISVVFHANGTATSDVQSSGVWHLESDAGFVRKYRVDWDQGKFVDHLYVSEDSKRALLDSRLGDFDIHRADK